MGGGAWTTKAFVNKVATTGFTTKLNSKGYASSDDILSMNVQDFYRSRGLADALNPYSVIRECRLELLGTARSWADYVSA